MSLLHRGMCLVRWLVVCHWGGEIALHSSSTVASSTTAMSTSEEEGLHAALFLTSSASTSATSLCSSEEEILHTGLPPRNVGMYLGGRGTGPLPHNVNEYLGGGGGAGPPPHIVGVYFGGRQAPDLTLTSASSEGGKPVPDLAFATTIRIRSCSWQTCWCRRKS